MPKNIVICSDGTGNTAIKNRGTNVFRLYEALDLHGWLHDSSIPRQLAFYDDGVGTGGIKPLRILGGAFGLGLSRNVKKLYAALARVYEPDDRIYLFGFSRGAFTVRTLAGMISECGIISLSKCDDQEKLTKAVEEAYELHRKHYHTQIQKLMKAKEPSSREVTPAVERFRDDRAVEQSITIEFMGVWDTVDAVGLPFEGASRFWNEYVYCYKFPDYVLSPKVKRAAHALALDDERRSFHPLLWDERGETSERIEQTWFPGVHSNVGGGYPKQGMSIVALDWMMSRAEVSGLRFVPSDREYYHEHANVHDHLYDSRGGLGAYYRYGPRDVEALCRANGLELRVHASAVERVAFATQEYAPGNLPLGAEVTLSDPAAPALGKLRDWLDPAEPEAPHLLAQTTRLIRTRRWTHALLVVASLGLVALGFPGASTVGEFFRNLLGLVTPSGLWQCVVNLFERWYGLPLVLPIALVIVNRRATRRMQQRFSHWWHPRRRGLHKNLESACTRYVEA